MIKFILFLFGLLMFACGAPVEDVEEVDEPDLGQVGQGWNTTYRPDQLIGTLHYSEHNARCTPTQATSAVCYLVMPTSNGLNYPQIYNIWVDEASFGFVYGPSIRNAVIAAIDKLMNPGLKNSQNVLWASFVLQSQQAGSQIRFSAINLAANTNPFFPNHMRVEFGQTSTLSDLKGPLPGTDMPGTWKKAGYANVRLDHLNLASFPRIDSAEFRDAAIHGILAAIGMGAQSLYSDTYTYNFLPTGAPPSNGWGSRCEEKYVYFYQSVGISGPGSGVFFGPAASGPCVLP